MSKTELKEPRKRKSPARPTAVVLGALHERLLMLPTTEEMDMHRERFVELFDELRRSISKKEEPEGE